MTDATSAIQKVLRAGRDSGDWEPVTSGESGAHVFRSRDGSRYAKCVSAPETAALEEERDRTDWLHSRGVPGPEVLDWHVTPDAACLMTSAVGGIPADRVPAPSLDAAWGPIADAVRRLHDLPVRECPFTRDLTRMFALARDVVERGAVNPEFLPVEQQTTPPVELLGRLAPQLERRLAQEAAEAVVCHGDLTLPNIVLDPQTLEVRGFIDLGRLGRADPYADIALLFATARETRADGRRSDTAEDDFARRYKIAPDRDRERFYLHLDPLTWG
ncbi:APH(3'') family aminoglycoside O-phosphotransferase [Streptomyces sp. NPDC051018]|uniref:APH(3'') family aminoglycoside O-phosphotransferase n=1 Tax=Streptomyces sp. NPDC051018 TaxID=3365639 RepID=UPI0037BD6AAE